MSATTPDPHRPRVLVAVEDPIARELIERMLHLAGFSALSAETGERALLLLRAHRLSVDWLVAGASLPGLVDAAILNDEYRTLHPNRAALFLAAPECASKGFTAAEIVDALLAATGDRTPASGTIPQEEALAGIAASGTTPQEEPLAA